MHGCEKVFQRVCIRSTHHNLRWVQALVLCQADEKPESGRDVAGRKNQPLADRGPGPDCGITPSDRRGPSSNDGSPQSLFERIHMSRRDIINTAIAASGIALASPPRVTAAGHSAGLDRYGGWTGKRFRATGSFRVERDDRWWLVTPDGNVFLSWGINHFHHHLWNQDHNRQAWKEQLDVPSMDVAASGSALRKWFLATCREYGFNSVGVHNSLSVINSPTPAMPYLQPIRFVDIPHWKVDIPDHNFRDVFAEDFALHCDRLAKQWALPIKDDPFVLGYTMTDCPLFTEEDCRERPDVIGGARRRARIGWPRRLRNLPEAAPGKKAYVEMAKDLYGGRIASFNRTYGTEFDSFDGLARAEGWRPQTDLSNPNETRDNIEFLKRVVHRYYRTAKDAIRRYDPHHLFLGDKLNANTDALDTVLPVTSRLTDLVFYQMYGRYEVQKPGLDRWARRSDKPLINGDSAFTMITQEMPRPFGPVADSLQQRIEWTEEFFRSAFARPDFVGWHYCGLIDADNRVPGKDARQHSGLIDGLGQPHDALKNALRVCSEDLYRISAPID